jgi:ParB family chromosome partitioning protein
VTPSTVSPSFPAAPATQPDHAAGRPAEIETGRIDPNPYQPRQDFDEDGIEELMASIHSTGIIQPVVLRPKAGGRYELVSGERRLRAAEALGLPTVPAIIRDVPDDRLLEMALIENIQRRDLNPIEKAEAFRDFMARYHLTQEEAARRIGVDRASLANHIRLLELPEEIQVLVRRQALGMSHARTIASLTDPAEQLELAKRAIRDGLSVRQLERAVQRAVQGPSTPASPMPGSTRTSSPQVAALENELRSLLGTKVRIEEGRKAGTGRIVVEYYSFDDFDRILAALRR